MVVSSNIYGGETCKDKSSVLFAVYAPSAKRKGGKERGSLTLCGRKDISWKCIEWLKLLLLYVLNRGEESAKFVSSLPPICFTPYAMLVHRCLAIEWRSTWRSRTSCQPWLS